MNTIDLISEMDEVLVFFGDVWTPESGEANPEHVQ